MATAKPQTTPQQAAANQPKILRIGVIQAGKIVEERLVRRRDNVTIGASPRNTIVVPASSLPRSFTLFEMSGGKYSMIFSDTMDGRVSVNQSVLSLEQIKQQNLAQGRGKGLLKLGLTDSSRGKVLLGEITLLFQFVAPPPIQPRPQLPPSVRGGLIGQMDWTLASSMGTIAALATAFLVYAHHVDFPKDVSPDVIPDDFAQYVPTVEKPKPKALDVNKLAKVGEKKVEKVAQKGGGRSKRRGRRRGGPAKKGPPCDADCQAKRAAARRARLAAQVAKMGALKILGAKGKGSGSTQDLLRSGDPGTSADRAFKGVGGLTTKGGRGKGGLRGKGGSGGGKSVTIGNLGGRVGGPGAVKVKGKVVEKVPRAIVKRSKTKIDGTLKGSAVSRVLRRGMRGLKGCYQRALKRNPKLNGKISIRLTVNSTGKVTRVEIESDSVGDSAVNSCIKSYARRWRFPPPEGGETVEVAFSVGFQASR